MDPKDLILMGTCVKKYRDQGVYVVGCPPGETAPLWSIQNREDSDKREMTARTRESEAENTRRFLEYAKKKKEKANL